jgi:PhnB protein
MKMKTEKKNAEQVLQPYLFFNGQCEQALDFYKKALGAEVEMLMRFKDSPEVCTPPQGLPKSFENKVMHAELRVGGARVMVSDGCSMEAPRFQGFSLTLTVGTEAEADRLFSALAEGGKVEMPLGRTFWSPRFGMLEDRFGVGWMVMAQPANGK